MVEAPLDNGQVLEKYSLVSEAPVQPLKANCKLLDSRLEPASCRSRSASAALAHRKELQLRSIWDFLDDDESTFAGSSSRSDPSSASSRSAISVEVSPCLFEGPCVPVTTSGGTAAFFKVRYRAGHCRPGRSVEHYIGKDLAHASDEVEFYDRLREASEQDDCWSSLAEVAMDCPGFCQLPCLNPKDGTQEIRSLLLLENLRQGFESMRLLDVKLGAETSVARWKGKTRFHAWKNSCIDGRTNSVVEGFRLEGMELMPLALERRIMMSIETNSCRANLRSRCVGSKATKRFVLQRLRARDFVESWLDVGALGPGSEEHSHAALWSAIESVKHLIDALVDIPVPQQWIGSSLAMGLEVGSISNTPRVKVKVFDWGRAELNTEMQHQQLPLETKKERIKYWRQYVGAVSRFYWELCRTAAHRCCCRAWKTFVFELEVEPIGVLRDAVACRKPRREVWGMGLFQVPDTAVKGGKIGLVIPLLGRHRDANGAMHLAAMLHVGICRPENAKYGEGVTTIEVLNSTQVPYIHNYYGTYMFSIRVIGFERPGDALLHMEKWSMGSPEATPSSRAYTQSTGPARYVRSSSIWGDRSAQEEQFFLTWDATLRFLGLGKDAVDAQSRLAQYLPKPRPSHSQRNSSEMPASATTGLPGFAPWPALLPPVIGENAYTPMVARVFGTHVVPWLDEKLPCPPQWM